MKCAQILMKGTKIWPVIALKKAVPLLNQTTNMLQQLLVSEQDCNIKQARRRCCTFGKLCCVSSVTWKALESDPVSWHGATRRIEDFHLVWGTGAHDHGLGHHPSHLGRLQVAHQDGHAVLHLLRERQRKKRKNNNKTFLPLPVFDFVESK